MEEIEAMHPESIVISPGPGRPEDAGNILEVIRHFTGKTPILGVCLGHQAICKALGGVVTYAKELMHGKTSEIYTEADSTLFCGLESPVRVARYHSLAASEEELPGTLRITAVSYTHLDVYKRQVLHPFPIANIFPRNPCHSYNGVHRRPYVM